MPIKFSAVKKVSLSQAVTEKILNYIKEGYLSVGDKLPPERKLCEEFGVSRTSLREGISSLSHLGILETVAGSGVYVRNSSPGAVLKNRLKSLRMDKKNIEDLVEFREGLESFIGELACRNASEKDINRLEKLIERMEKSKKRGHSITQEDVEFHKELAAASHNEFVIIVFASLMPFILRWVQAREEVIDPNAVAGLHRRMVEEIRNRRPDKIRNAIKEHFQHMRSILRIVENEKEEEK